VSLWGYDISSAYPYQLAFLPCLKHTTWKRTKDRKAMKAARCALVRYSLSRCKNELPWGPFPFRDEDGSISFPLESGGGWVWRDEYFAGERYWKNVRLRSAWIGTGRCRCSPFARIPHYYRERLRIGKEGAGIVHKLGPNSCYGKLAQSVGGNPPFQSWVWAGMITSGCRAQILELMGLHRDMRNVLAIATDGVYTRERLARPVPRDTGTYACVDKDKPHEGKKPLGGWEEKEYPKGLFFARPGIYFPVDPTEEQLSAVRARGIGRASLLAHWRDIVEAHESGRSDVLFPTVRRFMGNKLTVWKVGEKTAAKDAVYKRSSDYGEWVPWPLEMSFDPLPKRTLGANGTLYCRRFRRTHESLPYRRSLLSPDAQALRLDDMLMSSQPEGHDGSFAEEF
jgi:hypothetical protein